MLPVGMPPEGDSRFSPRGGRLQEKALSNHFSSFPLSGGWIIMRTVTTAVEFAQHIRQSAPSAALIGFLWKEGTDPPRLLLPPSSKTQRSSRLFCCSHLILCIGEVTQ